MGSFGKSVIVEFWFAVVVGTERRVYEYSRGVGPNPTQDHDTGDSYTGYSYLVPRSELAANGRWSTSEQNSVQRYCCTLTLKRDLQLDTARSHHRPTADVTRALRLAGRSAPYFPAFAQWQRDADPALVSAEFFRTRHANICIRFRRPDDAYLELWTSSGLLATASDYYKTLLASGCAETIPSSSKRKRGKAPPPIEHKASGHGSPMQPTID